MDCAVQCFSSSDDAATLIISAGSWSHILSTMTSTCVLIMASPRARCSTSSVHVRRFGCTAGKFDSNEVRTPPAFLAATRCGADVMRLRCDGDATAMRRRCDGDANAQTATQPRTGGAQKPAQKPVQNKPAQKPVQNMQIFLAKILQDSDTYSSRYVQVSGS